MTRRPPAAAHLLLWLRIAATLAAWVLIVVYVHRLGHVYQEEIAALLRSPLLRILATTALITSFVYLAALSLPFVPAPGPRTLGMVFVWALLLVAGHALSHMGFHDAQAMLTAMREAVGPFTLVLLAVAYAVSLALPFVPGVELGLLIMAVFGPQGALVAYAATLGGLSLVYALGRMLPERVIVELLGRVGIAVPQDGIASTMQDMVAGSRLRRTAPGRWGALLLEHRYVSLAICLNFPGNSVVGGGGGLGLLCGLSRQFSWRGFLLAVAVATSPVPILVLAGWLDLEPLMHHHGFLHDALTGIQSLFVHE